MTPQTSTETSKKTLLKFIINARKKGYSDSEIHKALEKNKWPVQIIAKAFKTLRSKPKMKNQICIFLSDNILKILGKRSKKNLFTISEQIEDILRRSCASGSSSFKKEKLDDNLIGIFSRSKKGRKSKKQKAKKLKKK